jgi:hypothetical protein
MTALLYLHSFYGTFRPGQSAAAYTLAYHIIGHSAVRFLIIFLLDLGFLPGLSTNPIATEKIKEPFRILKTDQNVIK